MDFIDYDTFEDNSTASGQSTLPEPAPPLLLPLNPGLTSKLRGLSLLSKKPTEEAVLSDTKDDVDVTTRTAEKYARISFALFQGADDGLRGDTGHVSASSGSLNEHFTTHGSKNKRQDAVLSSKLANTINSYNLNESGIREALSILQQKQDLDLAGLIRSDMLGSINRRRLRSEIEGDLLKEHTSLLREFQPVVQKIDSLGQRIEKLNSINHQLNNNTTMDPKVMEEIESLSHAKNLIILKAAILNSFKTSFTLTQYEEHFLSNEDVSLEYFKILHKCKTIHTNCSILLTLQNASLGMTIMEKMSKFLDMSFQRIAFFLSTQLDRLMSPEERYADPSLRPSAPELRLVKISIFYLSTNLKYFDEITSKLIQSRAKSIVEEFMYQSNNADSFDNSRPIILSAHDPLRYIGDILAFVHSTIVNEVELINGLFEMAEGEEYEQSEFEKELIKLENLEDVNRSIKTTTEKIVGALSRPLKSRVEQIIRSEKRADILQKVFGLLDLYKVMYSKQLGSDSQCTILETLDLLKVLCVERVFAVLREKQTIMQKVFDSDDWALEDDSLLPPDWLREWLSDNLVILEGTSGMSGDSRVMDLDDNTFESLVDVLIQKPLDMVKTQATKNFKSNKVYSYIFQLNCLDHVASKIVTIAQLSTKTESINSTVSEMEQSLIDLQYTLLLKDAGLDIHQQLIQLVFPIEQIESEDDYFMYTSLIENKLFGKDKLQEIEVQLHEFLPTALVDIQQAVFSISSPSIANTIISESSLRFIKLYEVFYKIVNMLYEDEETSILEFTAHDVATLLGVSDLYKH